MTTRFALQSFLYDAINALWQVYRNPHGPLRLTVIAGPAVPRGDMAAGKDFTAMAFILPNTHKVALSLKIVDVAGNPATVDGPPVWSVSDPDIVTLDDIAADGLSATAVAVGPPGTSQVNVTADADLGEGVRTLTALLDIEVRPSEAVALTIEAGAPVPKAA